MTQPWNIMQICGGQTHAIMQYGLSLDQLLPAEITLIHGPGCPVCVTLLQAIEQLPSNRISTGRDLHHFWRYAACARQPGGSSLSFVSQGVMMWCVAYSPLDP